ncbi:MAG: DNA-directed RNA polymerase subunit beta, partial [bacterium]
GYSLGEPKYDPEECRLRGVSYAMPMRLKVQLATWEIDEDTKERKDLKDIKEQEIYFDDMPCMSEEGTFIINGTVRVIVNQLQRSPGTFFSEDKKRTKEGNRVFKARLIPYHGSWIDFEYDARENLHVKIDRKRKIPVTVFLKAWGYNAEDIISGYYLPEKLSFKDGVFYKTLDTESEESQKILMEQETPVDIKDDNGKILLKSGKRFSRGSIRKLIKNDIKRVVVDADYVKGKRLYSPLKDPKTGEIIADINDEITATLLDEITGRKMGDFEVIYIRSMLYSPGLSNTLKSDKTSDREEALMEIYKTMVPSNPVNVEVAEEYFKNMFHNPDRYNMSSVGRLRLNHRFNEDLPLTEVLLRKEDVFNTAMQLLNISDGRGSLDDIDHLGNRRVRLVGELLMDVFKTGLTRMSRTIREKIAGTNVEVLTPFDVINYKQVSSAVKEFFAGGQLSQFMDQTNVLSELTHKRRLSALGPGGLQREHASFEVRDVHRTHFGRICPVETPEGPNVGLIVSLTTYSEVNKFGYIETPYYRVENGKVTEKMVLLNAMDEEDEVIVSATTGIDDKRELIKNTLTGRKNGEMQVVKKEEVTLMNVAPFQIVSVSAALIPFLEHDDANRALMGSNMQRQGVPLIKTDSPLVGSGMERFVAQDSGYAVYAKRVGKVVRVDADRVVVKVDNDNGPVDVDIYNLQKYRRSNQSTSLNQKPVVSSGDILEKGDVIADGPGIYRGELALGKNMLIAFMPWRGYNFEDSILVNERVVRNDMYTSVHIEEFVCEARETKRGPEEITSDIPNASEEILKKLDESGIIRRGQKVTPGDILVGKVTPTSETVLSPEEKLLRAIFGEKAGHVKDTSLKVPSGVSGIVMDTRIFIRKGVRKDDRIKEQEMEQIRNIERNKNDELSIIEEHVYNEIRSLLLKKKIDTDIVDGKGKITVKKGIVLTEKILADIPGKYLTSISVSDVKCMNSVRERIDFMRRKLDTIKKIYERKIKQITREEDLSSGVIKMVKVFVAIKRPLSVGDKMANRHGNKGVVSRVLPEEDMPYMEDGTTADIVFNPLGVPSRMNVGQILETHLGLAARKTGEKLSRYIKTQFDVDELRQELKKVLNPSEKIAGYIDEADEEDIKEYLKSVRNGVYTATPVFDGAEEKDINGMLEYAEQEENGKMILFDGRTGEPFENDVTVGVMYIMKLHHLVDEKVHARSTGPYSLVTQQPLGGKAQFGGQRLGEMEVWALEAYGAAYTLEEFLTVKSDDVEGRKRLYESIIRRKHDFEVGIPASFSVLQKEMQSLCLDFELIRNDSK